MDTSQNGESRAGERGSLFGCVNGCGGLDYSNEHGAKNAESQQKTLPADSLDPGVLLVLRTLTSPFKDEGENGPTTWRRRRLAKLVKRDGAVEPHEGAKNHEAGGRDVSTFDKLFDALTWLSGEWAIAAVQGGKRDSANPRRMQRIIQDTPDKDDPKIIHPWTITDKPLVVLPIDIDDLIPPPSVRGLLATALWVIEQLPPDFHGVRCIAMGTGSYGLHRGAHIRLWFMLDRALTCGEKRRWLKPFTRIGYTKFVDIGLYTANQLVYTASPTFEDINDDPLFDAPRLIVIDGKEEFVRTPHAEALKSSPHPSYHAPSFHIDAAGKDTSYGLSTLGSALFLIYNAPNKPIRPRHEWIRIACQMVALPIILELLNAQSALEQLIAAAISIGDGSGERRDWASETRNLFDWALRKEAADIALEERGGRHDEA